MTTSPPAHQYTALCIFSKRDIFSTTHTTHTPYSGARHHHHTHTHVHSLHLISHKAGHVGDAESAKCTGLRTLPAGYPEQNGGGI